MCADKVYTRQVEKPLNCRIIIEGSCAPPRVLLADVTNTETIYAKWTPRGVKNGKNLAGGAKNAKLHHLGGGKPRGRGPSDV